MIPFLDLHKVNERFRGEIERRFAAILDAGWYIGGKENATFAAHFAAYCGTRFA